MRTTDDRTLTSREERNGPPQPTPQVTYFEPVAPRLGRHTIIESTFVVGRRFRCTMRVDCGQIDPGTVIRPVPGEWRPRMPERLDEEELADATSVPAYPPVVGPASETLHDLGDRQGGRGRLLRGNSAPIALTLKVALAAVSDIFTPAEMPRLAACRPLTTGEVASPQSISEYQAPSTRTQTV